MRIRVGVLGAGSWAVANHIPILAARGDVDLVVVNRKGAAELGEIQRLYGFRHATEHVEEALAHDLDAVVVASPPALHYAHARAALVAGAHILCEKPFTLEPAHAWELTRLAADHGLHLVVGFGWNYTRIAHAARQLLSDNAIGAVEHLTVHMSSAMRPILTQGGAYQAGAAGFPPDRATWSDPSVSGGGYAAGQLSHAAALALWLTGFVPARVAAAMHPAGSAVDLHAALTVVFAGGATGVFSGASCPRGAHQLELRIYGSDGQVVFDAAQSRVWRSLANGEQVEAPLPPDAGVYRCDGPPNTIIDLALGRPVENCSPAELGARTVDLIAAAYRGAETGQPQQVVAQQNRL